MVEPQRCTLSNKFTTQRTLLALCLRSVGTSIKAMSTLRSPKTGWPNPSSASLNNPIESRTKLVQAVSQSSLTARWSKVWQGKDIWASMRQCKIKMDRKLSRALALKCALRWWLRSLSSLLREQVMSGEASLTLSTADHNKILSSKASRISLRTGTEFRIKFHLRLQVTLSM